MNNMKELIEYIWNAPMWIILTIVGLPIGFIVLWFVYLFRDINKTRKRNYDRMHGDFERARKRVQMNLK